MLHLPLDLHIAALDDPNQSGKSLKGELGEFWRIELVTIEFYEIKDDELVVLATTIGHRKEVYDSLLCVF